MAYGLVKDSQADTRRHFFSSHIKERYPHSRLFKAAYGAPALREKSYKTLQPLMLKQMCVSIIMIQFKVRSSLSIIHKY